MEIEMSDKADRESATDDYCGGHAERVLEFGVDFDSAAFLRGLRNESVLVLSGCRIVH